MVTTVGIKLDNETKVRLNHLGQLKDRSSHWLMKRAVAEYLQREEHYEQEKAADAARWQRYEETGEFVTNDDMMQWIEGLATIAQQKI